MRRFTTTIALAALLFSRAAGAAGGGDKDPGKGASAPPAGGESPGGGKTGDTSLSETRDTRGADAPVAAKVWDVGVGVEYHHILDPEAIDNDANRNLLYYSVYGRWDITPNDRLSIRWGLYQPFIIDSGDSPVRADDVLLAYTRRFRLPGEVTLLASFSATIPVSYGSQLAGVYTVPRLSLTGERRFGHLTVDARVAGGFYIVKFAEGGSSFNDGGNSGFGAGCSSNLGCMGGGANPNPRGSFNMLLSGDFSMPFHDPLSVGLSLYTGYTWFYDVGNGGPATGSSVEMYGAIAPGSQPFQQSYGAEVYVRYAFPNLAGFKSDLAASYAPNGDPTLGYASVQHGTGVDHVYPFYYRQTSEVYFTFSGHY